MTIFETQRLTIRLLKQSDLPRFHEMESDPNVMRYTSGEAKDMAENTIDLNRCIHAYSDPENRFRIWMGF